MDAMKESATDKMTIDKSVRDLHRMGFSMWEISRILAVSTQIVNKVLVAADEETRERRIRMEQRDADLAASYRTERLKS